MADMNSALQIKRLRQCGHIGRIGIHLISLIRLGRAAMPPAIMGDHPIAFGEKIEELVIPFVRCERPAMMKHEGLGIPRSPVFVKKPDTVRYSYEICHHLSFFCWRDRKSTRLNSSHVKISYAVF